MTWPVAFAVTVLVEALVAVAAGRALGWGPRRGQRGRWVVAVVVANLLTHPALWAWTSAGGGPGRLLVAEGLAVLVEAAVWWGFVGRRCGRAGPLGALALSQAANAASLGAGLALPGVAGWFG